MHRRQCFAILIAFLAGLTVLPASAPGQKSQDRYTTRADHDVNGIGKFYMGREIAHVMGFQGAGWLERPEREKQERLLLMVESLGLRPGMTVADIGAGSGVIARLLARAVGDSGKILAVDVQEEMLARLKKNLEAEGITNVEPIRGTPRSPGLPPASVDLAIMVDVYHEFEFPWEMLSEISRALKPGGRVCFVEYRKEDPTVPIKIIHKMTEQQVIKEASQPGLNLKWTETIGVLPQQHMVFCTKQPAAQDDTKKKAARPPIKLTQKAIDLHKSALVLDGHNDLPWTMRAQAESSFDKIDIAKPTKFHTDIPRLRQGNVGAQFWSVYVPASLMKTQQSAHATMEQIDLVHRMIRRYPETFELALTADDVVRIHKSGKIASMLGMEGGHSIEESLGLLRTFHRLGVRYMTLTHSKRLSWADSATDDEKHGGLTPFGEEVVRTMNELGMLVDISHVSIDCMKDAIRVSRAPVIASHSSARAVADHPRNVPDEVLRLLPEKDGVIMVNYFSGFVVPAAIKRMNFMADLRKKLEAEHGDDESKIRRAMRREFDKVPLPAGTIHDVLDHIEHIIKVAGINHVGLGSDYDGISRLPAQLEDVASYPYITQGLLDRGYSEADIRKVLGLNVIRVMRKTEAVAKTMQSEN